LPPFFGTFIIHKTKVGNTVRFKVSPVLKKVV